MFFQNPFPFEKNQIQDIKTLAYYGQNSGKNYCQFLVLPETEVSFENPVPVQW